MMSVFTLQTPRQDTRAEPGIPWRGMLWVTWRQHRGLLVSVPLVFAVAVAAMVTAGLRIHHDFAVLVACRPAGSASCQRLSSFFNSTDWHEANALHVAVQAAPVLLAMFAGPPVLARELENGTFRYAWTQGIGRVRWTAGKLIVLGSVIIVAAFAISQLLTWFFAPFLTTQNLTDLTPTVFDTIGVVYAAWTLIALCLGAFLGMLLRRILAAMAVTVVAYLGLAALTWFYLRDHYPVHTYWPMQVFEAGWLAVLSGLLIAATIALVRRHAI
jgi:hypothetical protein